MTTAELLSAFSCADAAPYAPCFEFSKDCRIVSVEAHAVGMNNTTARYSGREDAWFEVNNILRLTTADGLEGVSGVDTNYQQGFSDEHLLELQGIAADIIDLESLDPAGVVAALRDSRPDLSDEVLASIDIALWDLAAQRAGLPLHKLLGASRDSMESYASLPFYESLPEYIEAVRHYRNLGFKVFKFHVWGSIEEDIELVKAVQQTFVDSDLSFMMDLECMYNFDEALKLGRQMDDGLFVAYEAPVDDELLGQYAELRRRLSTQIIPAGYRDYSAEFIRQGIAVAAWDAGRFDATVVGGISSALELLIIANEADLAIDIQSWGHSLGQTANLHLMLANRRTRFFEAPMPKEAFEFGMLNGDRLEHGRTVVPDAPGLGIAVSWEQLPTADYYRKASYAGTR